MCATDEHLACRSLVDVLRDSCLLFHDIDLICMIYQASADRVRISLPCILVLEKATNRHDVMLLASGARVKNVGLGDATLHHFTAEIGTWTCLTKGSEIAFWEGSVTESAGSPEIDQPPGLP